MNVLLTDEQKINAANSEDLYIVMRDILARDNKLIQQKEHFWIVGLTNEYLIDYIELLGLGRTDQIKIGPVDVFSTAVSRKVKKVILVHSVDSDQLEPTPYDITQTKQLSAASNILEILLLNHMIINTKDYNSFL